MALAHLAPFKGLQQAALTLIWVGFLGVCYEGSGKIPQVMDTKFGTNVSNKISLNAAKFQGYSFYRF